MKKAVYVYFKNGKFVALNFKLNTIYSAELRLVLISLPSFLRVIRVFVSNEGCSEYKTQDLQRKSKYPTFP